MMWMSFLFLVAAMLLTGIVVFALLVDGLTMWTGLLMLGTLVVWAMLISFNNWENKRWERMYSEDDEQ